MTTSRTITTYSSHIGSNPVSANMDSVVSNITLSAMGSSQAPSTLRWFSQRARLPSSRSVIAASTNSQNAPSTSCASKRQATTGASNKRDKVSRLGKVYTSSDPADDFGGTIPAPCTKLPCPAKSTLFL